MKSRVEELQAENDKLKGGVEELNAFKRRVAELERLVNELLTRAHQ